MVTTRCTSCKTASAVPRLVCPNCGGRQFGFVNPDEIGTVESWTRFPNPGGGFRIILILRFADSTRTFGEMVNCVTHPEIGDTVKRIATVLVPHGERLLVCGVEEA